MSLFLEAPDSNLRIEARLVEGLRAQEPNGPRAQEPESPVFAFRILYGRNAVTSWCTLPAGFEVDEDVPVRVKCAGNSAVVREGTFTLRGLRGKVYKFRIALSSGCVVFLPSSKKIAPHISMASAFSCGYTLSSDGRIFCLTKAETEGAGCGSALLFYNHGRCSAFMRRFDNGIFEFDVADRPADLVVPRRLAAEVLLPQADVPVVDFTGSQPSRNVRDLYLGVVRFCMPNTDEVGRCVPTPPQSQQDLTHCILRIAHLRIIRHSSCITEINLEPGAATHVHAQAMVVLTSSDFDASTGFRGEFGEYFCMARRSGDNWTVAAVTVKMRVLTLFFPYLDDGAEYTAEWILDEGSVLPDNIEHVTPSIIRTGDKAVVKMPAFGGFVLKLKKRR